MASHMSQSSVSLEGVGDWSSRARKRHVSYIRYVSTYAQIDESDMDWTMDVPPRRRLT